VRFSLTFSPDIYLFDDPLSALDGNVGEYLMETTISKELKGKTRIIVTHALHFLKYADKILYCDDGRITFKGSYKMLKDEPFFKKMMQMKQEEEIEKAEEEKKQKKTEKKKKEEKPKNEVRKLEQGEVKENPLLRMFSKEDRNKGRLSCSVIHTFIKNTGGYPFFMLYFILSVAGAFGQFYGVFYLLRWAGSYDVNTRWNELKVLTSIICGYCTLAMIRYYSYLALGVRLSRKIHANMVFRVLHAPVEEFLELVPKGRILNRFTKDVHTIDKVLIKIAVLAIFKMIQFFVSFYFMAKSLNVGICAVLTFFFICSIMIQNRSMNLKREIIRLEAISKSPIVTWASQTVKGLAQIRSTFKQQWFVAKMIRLIEANLKNSVLIYGLDSWFQLRISLLNVFLVQIPAFVFIIVTNYNGHSIAIEQIAMFLILSTALTDDIIAVLQSLSEFEASLIAIERCEFFNNIPPEAQYKTVVQEEKKFMMLPSDVEPSSLCLPQEHKLIPKGHVVFENVTARYGEDSEPVLKNLTFEVQPGEKVGIVGRTGAGKSSLIKLFWLSLRPSSGRVVVDGTDISTIDLKELRNEVMIVSQESALFLGSLRENIDPTSTKERDPELIMALDKLGFKNKNIIDKGLDYKVDAGGANFSQGERQVICFSRTLINKRKLIVLDEATANIDITTEQCIQKAQETEFKESTMFIIAHRINTVMNCDKIMVLKFGELMEFDSPENLLKNEDSYFKQIYDKMVEQNDGM
jgi:ABC-type multidrug transport system fused ATPase/permease subunit